MNFSIWFASIFGIQYIIFNNKMLLFFIKPILQILFNQSNFNLIKCNAKQTDKWQNSFEKTSHKTDLRCLDQGFVRPLIFRLNPLLIFHLKPQFVLPFIPPSNFKVFICIIIVSNKNTLYLLGLSLSLSLSLSL